MSASAIAKAMRDAGCTVDQIVTALQEFEDSRKGQWYAWPRIRLEVLQRDGYVCRYCCGHGDQCDHVIPRSRGGRNIHENLVASCKSCNSKKKNKTPEEWRGGRGK